MRYKMTAAVHEEYGELGVAIETGRDYFQPASSGLQVAHDILEHPVRPHSDGFVDELMALGGYLRGRANGDATGILYDVQSLAEAALYAEGEWLKSIPTCKSYLQDPDLMERIEKNTLSGIREALDSWSGGEYSEREIEDIISELDVRSAIGWICKGYQLFSNRFNQVCCYNVSHYLFDKITKECDQWLKIASEGDTATLVVTVKRYEARVDY